MTQLLTTKIHHAGVWHASGCYEPQIVSSGSHWLDGLLPAQGWQTEAIYEAATQHQYGLLSLLQPTLYQLSQKKQWLILLNPPRWVKEMLTQCDEMAVEHLLVVHGKAEFDVLWSTEQALRQSNAACVLAWPERMESRDIQRLKLAARKSQTLCFMFPESGSAELQTCQLQVAQHQAQMQSQFISLPASEQIEQLDSSETLH